MLPVERELAGDGPRYTPREIAEASGDLDLLQRFTAALGVPYPEADERALTEDDLEPAWRIKAFRQAGLPEDGMLQVARTIGMGTARIAEANRELVIRTLMQPGDTERDLALRLAAGTVDMAVCFADLVEFTKLGEEVAVEELRLVQAAEEEGEQFPSLRAGSPSARCWRRPATTTGGRSTSPAGSPASPGREASWPMRPRGRRRAIPSPIRLPASGA